METYQNILVTWPELWHNIYEAHFDPNNFWDFKKRVWNIIEIPVNKWKIRKLSECDYPIFCEEIKKMIANSIN